MSRSTRLAFVLVLAFALAAPSSQAAGFATARTAPDAVARLWSLLASLWAEAGCILDPHGGCTAAAPAPPDEGCGLDPHGGCSPRQAPAALLQPDEGCILDPNGGCSPRS